jgi:serine/threonine protein kinase
VTTVSTQSEPQAIGANDQDLQPGDEVGEYRVETVLGRGGFGVVFAGVHPLIGKRVAIKVLARKFSADPTIVSRFVAEAKAVNQIRHRNIIDIFSFGQLADGRHYYVMEYLDGEPLDAHLRAHGPMPLDEALPILRAIARALDAAHAKGIAHRDLKPENIFLAQDPDGARYPKLLDFGIAKLLAPEDDVVHKTATGAPIGTPYYMSPEQCRGRDVDHRTDIYSFGIVTYRLLTGTFPIEGDDYMDLMFKQINDEPPPPSTRNPTLTPAVDDAVAWMMRKDRQQRPPNLIEGVNALDPSQSTTAPPPSSPTSKLSVSSSNARQGAISGAHTSGPDALAATYTPEFERVSTVVAPQNRRRAWPMIVLGVLVLAAAATVAFVTAGSKKQTAAVSPAPAPQAAPAAASSSTAAASVNDAAVTTPQVVAPPPEPPAQPPAQPSSKKRVTTKKQGSGKSSDSGDAAGRNRDVIHLGSDIFSKDPSN